MSLGVSSPCLVGRTDELAAMSAALASAADGNPAVVVIFGVSGVGKTRLVTEFREAASARGARVLVGNCLELASGTLPLGPVAAILRDLVRTLGPDRVAAVLGAARWELARFVPGLDSSGSAPETTVDQWVGADADLDRGQAQTRLFDQLLGILGRMSSEAPTVVVLEDVQAVDGASRDLISFLLHNFRDERVLLVLTFRTEYLPRGHPHLGWIAELGRHPRCTMLTIGSLSPDETAMQVEAILGAASEDQLASRIYDRSGGNPLFTEELVAAARSGSATLPDALAEMLLAKVRALPTPSAEVLRAAAVAARPFDEAFLAAVMGGSEADYLTPVRQAVDGQVLVADAAGYRFRHGLFAEAIVEDLTSGERRDLHARVAAALEARPESADGGLRWVAGEAAKHWLAADRPTEAYRSSIEAALAASALHAYTSALEHWEMALALGDRVEAATLAELLAAVGLDDIDLLVRAAWAADLVGQHDRAIELAEAAIGSIDPATDPARAGTVWAEYGQLLWFAGHFALARNALEEAAALIGPGAAASDRARVLGRFAAMQFWRGQFGAAIEFAREAVEAARASGLRPFEVEALGILGDALYFTGSSHEAIERFTEARQTAADAGSVEGLLFATDSLADCLVDTDHLEEAIAVANRGADDARRFGLDRRFGAMFRGQAGLALFELGRWAEAEAIMSEGLDTGHGRVWGLSVRARLLAAMGRTDEATASLAAILKMFPEGLPDLARLEHGRSAVDVLLVKGDFTGALETATRTLDVDYPSVGLRLGLATSGLRAAADLAELGRARRHGSAVAMGMAAAEVLGAEVARQREILAGWDEPTPSKLAAADMADAELARLAGASDPEQWAAIGAAHERVPMPFPIAYARYRQAEALLVRDRAKTIPADLLRTAYETCRALRASPLIGAIESLARRARIELVATPSTPPLRRTPSPAARPPSPAAGSAGGPAARSDRAQEVLGLSARELEVLALVADGRTNGEIGRALFITRKTAAVHVTHILDKLGARNRVEAATIAARAGLTDQAARPGS
jgi:DNA-binding CsgD family transcriptional regulator/tetratricopeptide (TPR) repeat protein